MECHVCHQSVKRNFLICPGQSLLQVFATVTNHEIYDRRILLIYIPFLLSTEDSQRALSELVSSPRYNT